MPNLADIARLIGSVAPTGDAASVQIDGVGSLESAGPAQVAFLVDERYLPQLRGTRAGAVVLGAALLRLRSEAPVTIPVLEVADANAAMQAVLEHFAPAIPRPAVGVHGTALLDASAKVGAKVAIGPNVVVGARVSMGRGTVVHAGVCIGDDVTIGEDCELFPNVTIRERCSIGNRVTINSGSVVGTDGFGYRWDGQRHAKLPHLGTVVIEDDVEIGSCSCVDRGKMDETRIGAGTKIDNLVQVGHNVRVGRHCILCAGVGVAGSSVLEDGVVLAGAVGVADRSHIGAGTRVGGMSGIHGTVPGGETVIGLPAVPYGDWLREQAAMRKLPELVRQLRDLRTRVSELENSRPG